MPDIITLIVIKYENFLDQSTFINEIGTGNHEILSEINIPAT